jgi:hypothetical protein
MESLNADDIAVIFSKIILRHSVPWGYSQLTSVVLVCPGKGEVSLVSL